MAGNWQLSAHTGAGICTPHTACASSHPEDGRQWQWTAEAVAHLYADELPRGQPGGTLSLLVSVYLGFGVASQHVAGRLGRAAGHLAGPHGSHPEAIPSPVQRASLNSLRVYLKGHHSLLFLTDHCSCVFIFHCTCSPPKLGLSL